MNFKSFSRENFSKLRTGINAVGAGLEIVGGTNILHIYTDTHTHTHTH